MSMQWHSTDLSLRDVLAALAMHAYITAEPDLSQDSIASLAYEQADAMLDVRDLADPEDAP